MKDTVVVSSRGQITLPSRLRRALGLRGAAVLTAEEIGGKIVLTPAMVVETETYSDAQIAAWNEADVFPKDERDRIAAKLKTRRA